VVGFYDGQKSLVRAKVVLKWGTYIKKHIEFSIIGSQCVCDGLRNMFKLFRLNHRLPGKYKENKF
jgi:hypothetical protein